MDKIKYNLLFALFISVVSFSVYSFEKGTAISAQSMNDKFSEIKLILDSKQENIVFKSFSQGELITKSEIETELSKGRSLGIQIDSISSQIITSNEMTKIFNQFIEGANNLPFGLVEDSGVKRYFDGSAAKSCNEYLTKNEGRFFYGNQIGTGYYLIDPDGNTGNPPFTAYCEMSLHGGGWTLVSFNNGNSGKASVPSNFFAAVVNKNGMENINQVGTASSLNLELISAQIQSKDIMFVAPAYGFNPLVELNAGQWSYNTTKCSGTFRHTSRTAGCSGQNANDNYNSSDSLNFAFNNGNEGIVPQYVNSNYELCYSGKGWCYFKIFFR